MKLSKSKLALAKVINENGGWPQDSEWAVQNGDHGRIGFSINKPVRHDRKSWVANGGFNFKIEVCKPLKNWHQNVLSREEYYQAYPKADADGWIEWNGGERPVCGNDDVDVVLVDGYTEHGIADEFDWHRDGDPLSVASYRLRNADVGGWINWNGGECPVGDGVLIDVKKVDGSTELAVHDPQDRIWGDTDHRKCIIAYRLHRPDVKPEFCESVMRSIPDPESKPTIEQLAQDYRNKLDYANRKQDEADKANMESDAALSQLEDAIAAIGFVITPLAETEKEPELVAAVKLGDQVECVESNIKRDKYNGMVGRLHFIDESDTSTPYLVDFGGAEKIWCHEVKFIRRP